MRRARTIAGPLSLLTLAALAAGCGNPGEAGNGAGDVVEVPTNVRAMTVERTDLHEYLTISGQLLPIHGTDVSTEETGVVAAIPRDKGTGVERGDAMVVLDRDLLEAEMRAAEARRVLAEYEDDRTRKLFEAKQVSREEMLRKETEYDAVKAQADVARLRWERAAVKAPFAGIVADRYVEAGELVAAGSRVARIVDPYTLKLASFVSEREVAWIETGAPATVTLDGLARTVEGTVRWISFEANPTNGKFQVEVHVNNAGLALRPGVVARAEILKRTHENVVLVPRDAVVLRENVPTLFVLDGDRARQRPVRLGADEGLMTIVLEGIQEGERIVVRGQRDLHDGSLVSVREEATALDGSTSADPEEVRAAAAGRPSDVRAAAQGRTP